MDVLKLLLPIDIIISIGKIDQYSYYNRLRRLKFAK